MGRVNRQSPQRLCLFRAEPYEGGRLIDGGEGLPPHLFDRRADLSELDFLTHHLMQTGASDLSRHTSRFVCLLCHVDAKPRVWLIDTILYRVTGLCLGVLLPDSAAVLVRLLRRGVFGPVTCSPGIEKAWSREAKEIGGGAEAEADAFRHMNLCLYRLLRGLPDGERVPSSEIILQNLEKLTSPSLFSEEIGNDDEVHFGVSGNLNCAAEWLYRPNECPEKLRIVGYTYLLCAFLWRDKVAPNRQIVLMGGEQADAVRLDGCGDDIAAGADPLLDFCRHMAVATGTFFKITCTRDTVSVQVDVREDANAFLVPEGFKAQLPFRNRNEKTRILFAWNYPCYDET